jgi:hypothetical protein
MGEAEFVNIAIPRKFLRRMASDLSGLDPSQAEEHWSYLSQAIEATEKSSAPSGENLGPGTADSYLYRRPQSFSRSLASSPTLAAFSSRASSAVPADPEGSEAGDNDVDVPILNLDLEDAEQIDQDLDAPIANLANSYSNPAISNLSRGTKRNAHHPDAPQISERPVAESQALRLRGGVSVMPWYCPRNGDRKALPRQRLSVLQHGGIPMMDGPNGPEIDSDLEDEAEGSGGEGNPVDRQGEDGGMEPYDEGDAPKKQRRESQSIGYKKSKGKGKKKEQQAFKVVVRKHRTSQESVSLMASFSAMSTMRHQQNLSSFISDLCPTALPESSNTSLLPNSSGLGALGPMLTRVDGLIRQAVVLDFHRMVALMQVALWLDW